MAGDDARVMAGAVSLVRKRLADGADLGTELENLWRGGYATGVRRGHQDREAGLGSAAAAPQPVGWVFMRYPGGLTPGYVFTYGGCDQLRPNCERSARVSKDGKRLVLDDTGEDIKVPVSFFWARPGGAP